MKINLVLLFLCIFTLINYPLHSQWMETNGPYADNITAFHFSNNVTLAGSFRYGIYRSTDIGKNWESTSYDYGADVTCFVTLNDTIFAGTYEQDVYRSVDSGYNWTRLTNGYFGNERVTSMVIHQDNIYAGTNGNGIFVCEDRKNFRPINGTLLNLNITSLLSIDTVLFAGTRSSGIFYSTDNGDNWWHSNNGLNDSSITFMLYGNGFILAGTNSGIFRSSNKGMSWADASSGLPQLQIKSICLHNSELYASSRGVYRSSNNGEDWFAAGLNDITIASVASSGSILFAGSASGLSGMFSSTDNGITWSQNNNGINKATVRSVVSQNSVLYAGSDDAGIFRSTNGGTSWDQIKSGLKVSTMVVKGYSLYAGTTSGLYRSTDGGQQWFSVGPNDNFVYSICTIDNYLFIGTGMVDCYVYRSSDNGNSWVNVLTPYPLSSVITMCANYNTLFAATNESSYRSTDHGNTWTKLSGVYSPETYFAINGSVYAGCNGSGIYRSNDNGNSWTQINTGLPPNISITVQSLNGIGDLIFAGAFSKGVFKSTNQGESWTSDGLSQYSVNSLHINDTYLYAGLYQNGVGVRRLDEILSDADNIFKLQQNYPNPFNPVTTISWHSPINSWQTIKIYDLLGREITTLVNEYKPEGSYEAEFDGSQLSSGVYFYQLKAGSFVKTKKMLLLQ